MLSSYEFMIIQSEIEKMTDKQLDSHFDKVRAEKEKRSK